MKTENKNIQQEEILNFDFDFGATFEENQNSELKPIAVDNLSEWHFQVQKKLTGKTAVIEIEPGHLRVVELAVSRKKYHILKTSEQLISADGKNHFPELLQHLKQVFSSKSARKSRIVLSLSGPEVITRKILVPKSNDKQLKDIVSWQLKNEFSNFNEDQIWDYEVIGETSDNGKAMNEIITAFVPEDFIQKYINLLASVNISVSQVVIKAMALKQLVNFLQSESTLSPDKVTLMAEINRESTNICFIRNGHLEFSRKLNFGSDLIDQKLSKPIRFREQKIFPENQKLQKIKKNHGILPAFISGTNKTHFPFNQIYHALYPVLQQFVSEFRRTLTYYGNTFHGNEIENIILTGNGCHLKNFDLFIQQKLGYKTRSIIPAVNEDGDPLFEHTAAFGAALCDPGKFNFIPKRVIKSYRFKSAQKILNLVSVLILLVLGAFSYFMINNANEFENIQTQMDQNYKNLKPSQIDYLKIEKELLRVQTETDAYTNHIAPSTQMIQILKLMSSKVPEDILIKKIDFYNQNATKLFDLSKENENTVFIHASVQSNLVFAEITLFEFLQTLKNCSLFESVNLTDKNSDVKNNVFEFSLECRLK